MHSLRGSAAVSSLLCLYAAVAAQELAQPVEQGGPTYQVTAPAEVPEGTPRLLLNVLDADTGRPTAARFTLEIDGKPYLPPFLNRQGLRFVSLHQGKQQRFVALYLRGRGEVTIPLPPGTRRGMVRISKGFEYLPEAVSFLPVRGSARVTVSLRRWSRLQEEGWVAADEHLHYERPDPRYDRDWLDMMAGDGLTQAHFLVLKGGNLPGIWADQFAFGPEGEGSDGRRWIRSGEEYRDGSQGHINLLGIREKIFPISTGGIGEPSIPYPYPPLYDVLQQARRLGGIGGAAHGGSLSRKPTALLDAMLGGMDFIEIANTHLYQVDLWYRLLSCGILLPPMAGTDLPNFPFRDPWQPFLGEVRTYVRAGGRPDFQTWKEAVQKGRTFVTSGPLLRFEVDEVGPGGVVQLPPSGGTVTVKAELASPLPLSRLEVVHDGKVVAVEPQREWAQGVHVWRLHKTLQVAKSGWLAARGEGVLKQELERQASVKQRALAHSAAVVVRVGDQPIRSLRQAAPLAQLLREQREHYAREVPFQREEHRRRFLELFDQALARLLEQPAAGQGRKDPSPGRPFSKTATPSSLPPSGE